MINLINITNTEIDDIHLDITNHLKGLRYMAVSIDSEGNYVRYNNCMTKEEIVYACEVVKINQIK